MAHTPHPKHICDEIFLHLKKSLLGVDDALLRELADNYGYTAQIDIDENDIIAALEHSGKLEVLTSDGNALPECMTELFEQFERLQQSGQVQPHSQCLLFIKDKAVLNGDDLRHLLTQTRQMLGDHYAGRAWYRDQTLPEQANIRLMLTISGLAHNGEQARA